MHGGNTIQRYTTGNDRSAAHPCDGISLSVTRGQTAWQTRSRVRSTPEGYLCSWMFLASTRVLQIRVHAEDPRELLVHEVCGKREARCAGSTATSSGWLERDRDLGMPTRQSRSSPATTGSDPPPLTAHCHRRSGVFPTRHGHGWFSSYRADMLLG